MEGKLLQLMEEQVRTALSLLYGTSGRRKQVWCLVIFVIFMEF